MNPAVTGLSPDARAAVEGWTWPGNVRELENRINAGWRQQRAPDQRKQGKQDRRCSPACQVGRTT
jgi:transcriptional regulator with GAF, ATPase, and Fis domain